MQLLYNSDSFTVVQIEVTAQTADTPARGGFEIVDKHARRESFIEGLLAERFREGVQALIERDGPNAELLDEYIGRFTLFAPQPLALH